VNWGKSIILAFILFGGFIATLVTVCMRQDINLVTKDYYKEELAFQGQIDRMAHTAMLSEKPSVKVESGDLLKVTYNDFNQVQEGALQLFRPSDPLMDKKFILSRSETSSQYFSTIGMEKGMYRARITWMLAGQEFYLEQLITL
jgi:hypothetical protein